jgi:hypothetical protein
LIFNDFWNSIESWVLIVVLGEERFRRRRVEKKRMEISKSFDGTEDIYKIRVDFY